MGETVTPQPARPPDTLPADFFQQQPAAGAAPPDTLPADFNFDQAREGGTVNSLELAGGGQDQSAEEQLNRAAGVPLYQVIPGPRTWKEPPPLGSELTVGSEEEAAKKENYKNYGRFGAYNEFGKQVQSGYSSGMAGVDHLIANIAGMLDSSLTPQLGFGGSVGSEVYHHIGNWAREREKLLQGQAAKLAGGNQSLPAQVTRGAVSSVASLPISMAATALGGPVGGMAALGALETADQGPGNMLKGAVEGGLMGKFIHVVGPAGRMIRIPMVMGAEYIKNVAQGVDPGTALANAMNMGWLSAVGGPGEISARELPGHVRESLTPRISPLLKNTLTPKEQASQDYLTQRGIQTPLSMQTGSKSAAGLEGTVQNLPGGGAFAEKMKTAKEQLTEAGRRELSRISPEPTTAEEAGSAVGGKLAADLEKTRSDLAQRVSPTPSTPELAGTKVLEAGKNKIRQLDQAADESYKAAWVAERHPANIHDVPVFDSNGRPTFDEEGNPITEKMALPIDVSDVQRALKPIADRYERTLSDTNAHASLGLKAMRNFIRDAPVRPLSAVEMDLGMFKEAARSENIPELRNTSQGLAASTVKALQDKIDQTMASAAYPGWDPSSGRASPALRHLQAGRELTAQKHDIADVFRGFGKKNLEDLEPVGVHRSLTWEGDAGIQRLHDVAAIVPETMPEVGRAFIDGGGNWKTLGPETKKVLFRDPEVISGLDKYYADAAKFGPLLKLEPVALVDRLTASMGKRLNLLRDVSGRTPEQMPQVFRSFVQGLLDKVTREGDIQKVQSTLDEWHDLDPESKALLSKKPATAEYERALAKGEEPTEDQEKAAEAGRMESASLIKDLDNLFFSLKRIVKNPNTSGSGFIGALTQMKGNVFKGLGLIGGGALGYGHGAPGAGMATGAGYVAGAAGEYATNAALAKLLFNPKFTRLLTEGLRRDMAGDKAGAALTARTLAKMMPPEEEPPR